MKRNFFIISFLTGLFFLNNTTTLCLAAVQTPWKSHQHGRLYQSSYSYNYTMGYRFTPSKDGQIIQLGGFFNGQKSVTLWEAATGKELASAVVEGQFGQWRFFDIFPVDVQAGQEYIVGAYLGSGATLRTGVTAFPQEYDDIVVRAAAYAYGNRQPTRVLNRIMYGQVDIGFVPADEIQTIGLVDVSLNLTRKVIPLNDGRMQVVLKIGECPQEVKSFGIVEQVPTDAYVSDVSFGGLVRPGRIEWLIEDAQMITAAGNELHYEIDTDSAKDIEGHWISMYPRVSGNIEEAQDE